LNFVDPFGLDTTQAKSTAPVKNGDVVVFDNGKTETMEADEYVVHGKRNNTNSFWDDLVDLFSGNVGTILYGTGTPGFHSEDLSIRDNSNLEKVVANQLYDSEIMALVKTLTTIKSDLPSKKDYKNILTSSKMEAEFINYTSKSNTGGAVDLPRVGFGNKKLRYNPKEKSHGGGYNTWYAVVTLSNGNTILVPVDAYKYGQCCGNEKYTEQVDKLLENEK
jgi:hypothetical protein